MIEQHKKDCRKFFKWRVSPNQAVNLPGRNWIQVNEEQAATILDFLYLLTRTYGKITEDHADEECNLTF